MTRSVVKDKQDIVSCPTPNVGLKNLIKPLLNVGTSIQAFFWLKYGIGHEFPAMQAGDFAFPIMVIGTRSVPVALQQTNNVTLYFALFLPRTVAKSLLGIRTV